MKVHLSRRQFLGAVALTASSVGAATFVRRTRAHPSTRRNVILIITDSMRRDALGCYGSTWATTPHLDAFAANGVRCENAYVCSFPTVPARHDIFTGTYTCTYKAWSPLSPATITMQQVLQSAGVYTALFADTFTPYRPDFNYQRDFVHVERIRGQENDPYITSSMPVHLPCDPAKLRTPTDYVTQYLRNVSGRTCEEDYFCARTMRAASDWLDSNHGRQPFFLCVDTFDPHEPWDPPKSYVEEYDPGYTGDEVIAPRYDEWRKFLNPAELKHCRALYAAEVSLTDRWIGHLLATIERLGLLENSLVLIVSDHGVLLGEHNLIGKGITRAGRILNVPLYPALCRIPL
ncbi:MAG TPA: sulfatase, partial [Gemmataceae bacterium]|nr:sulfatase [Gemmataceae bacterium]